MEEIINNFYEEHLKNNSKFSRVKLHFLKENGSISRPNPFMVALLILTIIFISLLLGLFILYNYPVIIPVILLSLTFFTAYLTYRSIFVARIRIFRDYLIIRKILPTKKKIIKWRDIVSVHIKKIEAGDVVYPANHYYLRLATKNPRRIMEIFLGEDINRERLDVIKIFLDYMILDAQEPRSVKKVKRFKACSECGRILKIDAVECDRCAAEQYE